MFSVINGFLENKDEEQAVAMTDYMKGQFLFLGIRTPLRKTLQKEFLRGIDKKDDLNKVMVLQLWSYEQREFQYFAIDYLIKEKKKLKKEHMDFVQTLIMTKPWWDTVDLLASHIVGELCSKYPELVETHMIPWSMSSDLWLRRTALLYQLKYKEKVDQEVLTQIIENNIKDQDFFIRKAIGWILREYSKNNKEWVKHFIETHELSPLSKKEASKYLE